MACPGLPHSCPIHRVPPTMPSSPRPRHRSTTPSRSSTPPNGALQLEDAVHVPTACPLFHRGYTRVRLGDTRVTTQRAMSHTGNAQATPGLHPNRTRLHPGGTG